MYPTIYNSQEQLTQHQIQLLSTTKYTSSNYNFHILLFPQFSLSHRLFLSQPQNTISGTGATFGYLLGVDKFFNYFKKKILELHSIRLPKYFLNP